MFEIIWSYIIAYAVITTYLVRSRVQRTHTMHIIVMWVLGACFAAINAGILYLRQMSTVLAPISPDIASEFTFFTPEQYIPYLLVAKYIIAGLLTILFAKITKTEVIRTVLATIIASAALNYLLSQSIIVAITGWLVVFAAYMGASPKQREARIAVAAMVTLAIVPIEVAALLTQPFTVYIPLL